jgi:glycerophosphoryl diester phosphodiesterase
MNYALDMSIPNRADYELALRHAPHIRFDQLEPFFPSVVGYTVFHIDAPSPSFPREVRLPQGAACAVEYAVWWDWEIQHLYELEHIWLYLDAAENVIHAEASWHGGYGVMNDGSGLPLEQGRLVLCSEPGKHAFAPSPQWLLERAELTRRSCGVEAGRAGLIVPPLFADIITTRSPVANRVVLSYLECLAFEPSFDFSIRFLLETATFVPWNALFAYIPRRVSWLVDELRRTIPASRQHLYKIAHRGASAYAPENSLEAFRIAAQMDADLVEVDVRLTRDGIPVVAHDSTLSRVYGVGSSIAEHTYAEIAAMTPQGMSPIPTFDRVAEVCAANHVGLYLDIKEFDEALGAQVINSLWRHELMQRSIVGSFRPDWLADLKAAEKKLSTSILFSALRLDPVGLAQSIHADYVHPCWEWRDPQPHTLLNPAWVERVHAAGLGIVCWHEERPEEIAALRALGVDAICSDTPDRLAVHRTLCPEP